MSVDVLPNSDVEAVACHPEALAEYVRIDTPEGPKRVDLWPHQRQAIRLILASPRVMVLKARQIGFTWLLALVALWWVISHPANTVLVVSIGQREADDFLRRVKRLYVSLPLHIRRAYAVTADSMTRFEIGHPDGPGVIVSIPSSSTAGRGMTVDLLIGDERPMWPNPDDQEASVFPAAALGHIVLGGTANGMDSFHERWEGAPGNGWATLFAPADARPDRSPEWIERERRDAGEQGAQEYPMTASEAFLASGRCAFDVRALMDLRERSCWPALCRGILTRDVQFVHAEERPDGGWWFWEWPEEGRDYLVTADTCGGLGGADYAAVAVYDRHSWDQVAAYHGKIEPDRLARELVKAGYLYRCQDGRPALLVPEANNHGQAVVALLAEWTYPNLYETERFDTRSGRHERRLGWETTTKTRPLMLGSLKSAVREGTLGIRDPAAIAEMFRFVVKDTGKEEADDGANDDRVVAHAIAAAVLEHSPRGQERPPTPFLAYKPDDPVTGY